ncbi:fucolectin-like [Saccoglossus kowalevskii]
MQLVERSDLLNFCEMQVMVEESQLELTNVAIGKTATQSSDWSASFPASNAVDGNTNTNWGSGSCTSTQGEEGAWWKVDLGANYLVYVVIVTNRQDCCETRIVNSEIRVGLSEDISQNTQCGDIITESQTSQANIYFQCISPIFGRYVSMQLVEGSELLNFCEMRVIAEEL